MAYGNNDWAANREVRQREQAQAASAKRAIISRYRALLGSGNPNSKWDQQKELVSAFYEAGYAGKPLNDELKAELQQLRDAYARELQQARERRALQQKNVYYQKLRILERMEGIAGRMGNPWDDKDEWSMLGSSFYDAGYAGKDNEEYLKNRLAAVRQKRSDQIDMYKRNRRRSSW